VIHPGIQFKSVKGDALFPDRNLRQPGSNLAVEAIPVHAQVAGRVPEADQARGDRFKLSHVSLSFNASKQVVDESGSTLPLGNLQNQR
jgi:hypothetical protein